MCDDNMIEAKKAEETADSNPFGFMFLQKISKSYKSLKHKHDLTSFVQIDSNALTKGQEW